MSKPNRALEALRYHVTGAIERGEAEPIVAIDAPQPTTELETAHCSSIPKP